MGASTARRDRVHGFDVRTRGSTTIGYWPDDVLGIEPYFERSGPDGKLAYIEFRIGDEAEG